MIREDGLPAAGTRDTVFHLFSDGGCTTVPVGGDISMPGVAIENGIFVELTVRPDDSRRSA
jgi:hypothetical protein